jgi:hypothetical protein
MRSDGELTSSGLPRLARLDEQPLGGENRQRVKNRHNEEHTSFH